MVSEFMKALDKHGSDTAINYKGRIVEWIGGNESQVEFVTTEIVEYEGREDALAMNVYYLVSHMKDIWVIDERKVLDGTAKEVVGEDRQSVLNEIG